LENDGLKAQIAIHDREMANRKLVESKRKRQKRSNPAPSTTSAGPDDISDPLNANKVDRLAKFFNTFFSIKLAATTFDLPRPPFAYNDPQRYLDTNKELGYAADLYHCFPEKYHSSFRAVPAFREIVSICHLIFREPD
jgi:hypothetical protein